MKHGIIILIAFVALLTTAFAQSGDIYYINEAGVRSDTIDFDIVFYQNTTIAVIRNVILENTSSVPLQIYKRFAPYFVIKKINNNTLEHNEFDINLPRFPYIISPFSKDSISISYTPRIDISPSQYPLGERMAKLTLQFTTLTDTITPILIKDFHLSVLKTKDFLASRHELLDFDSVYVGTTLPDSQDWVIKNTTSNELNITEQHFTPLITRFNKEFQLPETLKFPFSFLGLQSKTLSVQYTPIDTGLNIARYSILYEPNIDNLQDSVSVELRGVGVEQIISLYQTSSSEGFSTIVSQKDVTISNNDTRIGDSALLTLIIRNDGNIPFGLDTQRLKGDINQFYILKKFREDHNLRPKSTDVSGELDTAIIVFKPIESGNFSVDYVIESDIRRRIATAPDSAKQRIIKISAGAAKPNLFIQNAPNNIITMDSVFLPHDKSCIVQGNTFKLQLANNGNAPLKIGSPVIRPSGVFSFSNQSTEIASNQTGGIDITLSPSDSGEFTAELLIPTNSGGNSNLPTDTTRIQLNGKAVRAPDVALSFPTKTITASAGRLISIPILASSTISNVGKLDITVDFKDSLGLEFDHYVSLGTASEEATVTPKVSGSTLKLDITSATGKTLLQRDTAITLIFKTFLSPSQSSPLLLLDAKAGNLGCADIFHVVPTNGTFALDSQCGQAYKVILNAGPPAQLRTIARNPTEEIAYIEYSIPYTTQTSVKMYTSFGLEVGAIADGVIESGTYQVAIPVAGLAPGVYYCIMQTGLFRAMQTIVVSR